MSAVKLKNAVVKAVNAAIATGEIPKGTVVNARLSNRRIWLDIDAAPVDVLLPERIEQSPHGFSVFSVILMAPDEKNYTPEGIALKAQVARIASAICPQGLYVHFTSKCFNRQGARSLVAAFAFAFLALTMPAKAQSSYDSFRTPGVMIDRDDFDGSLRFHRWGESPSSSFYPNESGTEYRGYHSDIIIERDSLDGSLSMRRWGEPTFNRFYPND
jgi:hypothetical protein